MTGIARETLDLRRRGILPLLSLLIPTFAFPCAPDSVTQIIQRTWNAPLPILLLLLSRAFGICFVRLTQAEFRDLRRRSGFFSSRGRTLAPAPLLHDGRTRAFGVRQDLIGGEALASYRSLYLSWSCHTRHLNAFRGVRAISKFDWPFTPTHNSSRSFSTLIGADLHPVLPGLHPGHV